MEPQTSKGIRPWRYLAIYHTPSDLPSTEQSANPPSTKDEYSLCFFYKPNDISARNHATSPQACKEASKKGDVNLQLETLFEIRDTEQPRHYRATFMLELEVKDEMGFLTKLPYRHTYDFVRSLYTSSQTYIRKTLQIYKDYAILERNLGCPPNVRVLKATLEDVLEINRQIDLSLPPGEKLPERDPNEPDIMLIGTPTGTTSPEGDPFYNVTAILIEDKHLTGDLIPTNEVKGELEKLTSLSFNF